MIIDILFQDAEDGSPDLIFVEVEDLNGSSLDIGEWLHTDDGYHALRLDVSNIPRFQTEAE